MRFAPVNSMEVYGWVGGWAGGRAGVCVCVRARAIACDLHHWIALVYIGFVYLFIIFYFFIFHLHQWIALKRYAGGTLLFGHRSQDLIDAE